MKKKLITLVKEMDFGTEAEYFDYLIECHLNGNFDSCKRLFSEMKKENQKEFINYLNKNEEPEVYSFYFNLL